MINDNLPPIGETGSIKAGTHLDSTGLGIEYFSPYFRTNDEFHTHKHVEFLFVLSGTFQHVTGDYTYAESAGGMAIINYNQFHYFKLPDGPFELMNIYWNPEKYPEPALPEPLASRLHELIPAHPTMGHRLNRIVRLHLEDPEETNSLLHMLFREQQEACPGSESAIDVLFRLLLIKICRAEFIVPENDIEGYNPCIENIRLYLEKHFTEPIRLEHLCELSGLKQTNLCRQFKKYTDLSIGNYLKQRRLAAAMLQLRTSSEKIMTVCHDCGFPDLNHFNHTFRKAIGKTPSDYRRRFDPEKDR